MPQPKEAVIVEFGAVAALYDLAKRLNLCEHMVRDFDIDLKRVLFDGTNFFPFIDTFNERCSVAQRGKNKEGRKALRIVGLALLVSADFHVPLFHRTYPGNQADAPTFSSLTEELVSRYRQITDGAEHVTIVFDKGNNSQDNLQAIEESPYHFIGSLVPTQHLDLLAVPARMFRDLDEEGLPGVRVHRCQREVFKTQRTVLVTYNENLFVAQSRTLLREIAKRQHLLRRLQHQLRRHREGKICGGSPPTPEGVSKKVEGWLKARHMKQLFQVEVSQSEGLPKLTCRFDNRAWERLQTTLLGKTILFTDNDHWSDDELGRIREVGILYSPPVCPGRQASQEVPTFQMTLSQMSDEQRTLYKALNLQRYSCQSV